MRKLFTLLIALLALTVSSWAQAPTVFTWDASDLATVNLTMGNTESQEIDHITVTLGYQDAWNDYCHFFYQGDPYYYCAFSMRDNGSLTFAPESGTLTSIVITMVNDYEGLLPIPIDEASGWKLDDENAKLLKWTGNAASVVLKSNSSNYLASGAISSIAFTVSGFVPTTAVTWEGNDLTSVNIEMENGVVAQGKNQSQTVNDITITANAPAKVTEDDYNYSYFGTYFDEYDSNNNSTSLNVFGEGSLTFAPTSGQLTKIVITCEMGSDVDKIDEAAGWKWDENTLKLTWTGDAASSVVLAPEDPETGFGFMNISSVVFTVTSAAPTPTPTPTPTGPSFAWTARQINLVDLSCYNDGGKEQENGLINNIITSLTQTRDKNEDYSDPSTVESCQFNYGRIEISGCGDLKFKSIAGDLTGIVITGNIFTATNLPANWTYDNTANTLTWVGTPAEEVTLSGNLSISVSSIEYFYDPAAAPRVDEEFYDEYQWYRITGAHTAKAIRPRNLSGTVNIPASVEDNSVIYYINEIAEDAFRDFNQLSNAFIGKNVAVIGAHAFDGCTWMTEIDINSRVVESIGDEAFKDCLLLHGLQCYTSLPPVLGSNAFEGDTRLNHIDVYSWVVSNYQGTANWSNYSSKITGLWSPRAIGEKFFYHNQKTTGVYEITSTSPKEVKVLPYPADVNAIYPITYESTLIIPESPIYMNYGYSVTGIAANAFKDITDIKVVSIPTTVKSIEAGAFSGCTNVENVFFLWDDPTTVTWADATVGAEFATATSGNTTIIVPASKLTTYQSWAPAWASRMVGGDIKDVTASQDPHDVVFYRTYYDGTHDLLLPPDVWAYVGYVSNNEFILRTIAFDGEIVPAGTAVVLRSFSPEYRLIAMEPVAEPYTGTNQLRGTDVNITIATDPELSSKADKIYVLGKEGWVNSERQEGMGLYRYTGTTLGAHKAYLIYDGTGSGSSGQQNAPARFLFKHENEATGVENVQSDKVQCTKVIRDGQLIIVKDGKEYNAQGLIIK